jgi:hypothetical protein
MCRGYTALIHAAIHDRVEVAKKLYWMDPKVRDYKSINESGVEQAAIDHAIQHKNQATAKFLKSVGASSHAYPGNWK